jgi:hypothetical protein
MEAMLGISLYSYPYLKLAKHCLSYYCLCILFNKIREKVLPGSEGGNREERGQGGEVAQTMYAHMNK